MTAATARLTSPCVAPHLAFYFATLFAACSYGLWAGGGPERAVAATMIAGTVGTRLTLTAFPQRYRSPEWQMLIVDLLVLAAFVAVATRADRRWPIAVAALHGLSVAAHAVKAIQPEVMRTVYWLMTNLWVYPQLAILAIGTARHRHRLKTTGADPSWSDFYDHS